MNNLKILSTKEAPLGYVCSSIPEAVVQSELIRQLRKALQDLPAKDHADKLVAFFFTKVNHIRYPIDERLFRQGKENVSPRSCEETLLTSHQPSRPSMRREAKLPRHQC